jgi:hypothetical protein
MNAPPSAPTPGFGDALVDELLARTESPDEPVEADPDAMVHVVDAISEEADESLEIAADADPLNDPGQSAPREPNPLTDVVERYRTANAILRKKLAAKTKDYNKERLRLARVGRVANQLENELMQLKTDLADAFAAQRDALVPPEPAESPEPGTVPKVKVDVSILEELRVLAGTDPNGR